MTDESVLDQPADAAPCPAHADAFRANPPEPQPAAAERAAAAVAELVAAVVLHGHPGSEAGLREATDVDQAHDALAVAGPRGE